MNTNQDIKDALKVLEEHEAERKRRARHILKAYVAVIKANSVLNKKDK